MGDGDAPVGGGKFGKENWGLSAAEQVGEVHTPVWFNPMRGLLERCGWLLLHWSATTRERIVAVQYRMSA